MNICVCGYYGMGNFGDELFLETFKQVFSEDTVFQFAPYVDVAKVDAVIIGGGDLIMPYWFIEGYFPHSLKSHPTWIYGVGIVDNNKRESWPLKEIEKNRQRISMARKAAFRDEASAKIAQELGFNHNIEVVPDIAYAYREPDYPIARFSDCPTIGICLYAYDDFPMHKMLALFCDWAQRGYHLLFIPVVNKNNEFSDMERCREVGGRVLETVPEARITVLVPHFDLKMTYCYIKSVDFLISFKLHPALVALRSGVPAFSFNKLGKVASLYKSLGVDYYINDFNMPFERFKLETDRFLIEGKAKMADIRNKIRDLEEKSLKCLFQLKDEIKKEIK